MIKDLLCNRLKTALKIRGIKQIELSEKTGIDKGALSSYISGKYQPKRDKMSLLCNALNVNELWLLGYDVPMEKDERLKLDTETTIVFEMTETNFKKNPDKAQAIFNTVGSFIWDMSKFSQIDKSHFKLSEIFNNHDVLLSEKLHILHSLVDVIKYDTETDEINICYNFNISNQDSEILNEFQKLNDTGKAEAKKRIKELTYLDDYRRKE